MPFGFAGNRYPRVLIGPKLASRQELFFEQAFEKAFGGKSGILGCRGGCEALR
jgi:hypothetical protein